MTDSLNKVNPKALLLALAVVLFGAGSIIFHLEQKLTAVEAGLSPDGTPVLNALAKKAGATAPECTAAVDRVTRALTKDARSGAYQFPTSAGIANFSLEVLPRQNGVSYVSLNASPDKDGHCVVSYDAVTHWTDSCDIVARNIYPVNNGIRKVRERIFLVSFPEKLHKVFLIPVVQGCIAVNKEIVP